MSVIKQAADSILPWLAFMADLPEDHASGMVPMLDLQVWVHHAQHQDQVTCPATKVQEVHPAGSGDPAGDLSQLDPIVRVMHGSARSGKPADESFRQLGPIVRVESGSVGNGKPAEESFSHQGLRVRGESDSTDAAECAQHYRLDILEKPSVSSMVL